MEEPDLIPTVLALPVPDPATRRIPKSNPNPIPPRKLNPNPTPRPKFIPKPTTVFYLREYQILQALPAVPVKVTNLPLAPKTPETPKAPKVPAFMVSTSPKTALSPSPIVSGSDSAGSSRCTRSQAAPDWTTRETLVLVSEIAALDENWLRALSSYQRWTIVAEHCARAGISRSYGQCKRRWEGLVADYKRIKELEGNYGRYLEMGPKKRRRLGLHGEFDDEVFAVMEAVMGTVIRPKESFQKILDSEQEDSGSDVDGKNEEPINRPKELLQKILESEQEDSGSDADGKSEEPNLPKEALQKILEIEHEDSGRDVDGESEEPIKGMVVQHKEALQKILESDHEDSGSDVDGASEEPSRLDDSEMAAVDDDDDDLSSEEKEENDSDKAQDMMAKLQENADKLQGILRGELEHNPIDSLAGSTSSNDAQLAFTRQQADELIKALGNLSDSLDQFAHLVKAGECEGIRPIDSVAV